MRFNTPQRIDQFISFADGSTARFFPGVGWTAMPPEWDPDPGACIATEWCAVMKERFPGMLGLTVEFREGV